MNYYIPHNDTSLSPGAEGDYSREERAAHRVGKPLRPFGRAQKPAGLRGREIGTVSLHDFSFFFFFFFLLESPRENGAICEWGGP